MIVTILSDSCIQCGSRAVVFCGWCSLGRDCVVMLELCSDV